ncbi:hypothetical protein AB0J82_21055 [Asanoa sp. NPDC049518]|uniref:hypothetical protein n=1 Tax=unclassified Asanoa TaxID=2685164 RepID=UPI0034216921
MNALLVSTYHNMQSRFSAYTDGDWLTGALSCRLDPSTHAGPDTAADWAFHTFNADLDQFTLPRTGSVSAETALAAKVYRLISLRSLSVGDVVAVWPDQHDATSWLACEPDGWRPIATPTRIDGPPLHVDTLRPYLRGKPATELPAHSQPDAELHRLCVFDLSLDCGHIATVAVNGWHPVNVACCDRLGGVTVHGDYAAFFSAVDYVNLLSERYEHRQPGAPTEPTIVLRRRPRTDEPQQPSWHGEATSAGRFPVRVGSAWQIGPQTLATSGRPTT